MNKKDTSGFTPANHIANKMLMTLANEHLGKTRVASIKEGGGACVYSGSGCAFSVAIKPDFIAKADEGDVYGVFLAEDIVEDRSELLHAWAKDCDPQFAYYVQSNHDDISKVTSVDEPESFYAAWHAQITITAERYGYPAPPYIEKVK